MRSVEVGFQRSVREAKKVVEAKDAWYKSADFEQS